MKKTDRLFHCLRCHTQVIICSDCDSGQTYCSDMCSQTARRAACRAADLRYQKTYQGKLKHAARQGRYRQRQSQKEEKVTDHASLENSRHDVLPAQASEAETPQVAPSTEKNLCHFCKKPVSDFLRHDFLGPDRGNSLTLKLFRSKSLTK